MLSRSHECLVTSPNELKMVDLSADDVDVKPVHSSLLGQDHCFQVTFDPSFISKQTYMALIKMLWCFFFRFQLAALYRITVVKMQRKDKHGLKGEKFTQTTVIFTFKLSTCGSSCFAVAEYARPCSRIRSDLVALTTRWQYGFKKRKTSVPRRRTSATWSWTRVFTREPVVRWSRANRRQAPCSGGSGSNSRTCQTLTSWRWTCIARQTGRRRRRRTRWLVSRVYLVIE